MSRTFKEFVKFFGPVAVLFLSISAWFLYVQTENHRSLVSQRQTTIVSQGASIIDRDMAGHLVDIRFLARVTAHGLKNRHGASRMAELESVYSNFAMERPYYYQIRFLDMEGQEQVRVDRVLHGPAISPREELQNKRSRYYFQRTARADFGDVYISKFDLNMEHGKLEVPYRPTIRFASPVMNDLGEHLGVAVLNFDGNELLARIRNQTESEEAITLFCNGKGYWFLAPNDGLAWGNVLGLKDATMAKLFPKAWGAISSNDSGQVMTDRGLFSFATLDTPPDMLIHQTGHPEHDDASRWKIVTWVKPERLTLEWANIFIFMTIAALIALAAGAWNVIGNRVRQARAEGLLRESEERLLAISQSAQDAIVMVNDKDRITYWNPAAQSMFGYDKDAVLGQTASEFLIKEPLAKYAETAIKGPEKVFEIETRHKDGTPIPLELSTSRFQLKGDWFTVGSMRNISRRKRSEMKLKQSEETARALLNAPTESALLVSPAGTIISTNEIGAKRLGGEIEDIEGKLLSDLMEEHIVAQYTNAIRQSINSGESTQFEDCSRNRCLSFNAYPVKDDAGNVESIALFGRDVTEQRQAEVKLRRSEQRFRDVSEAVGEFIWETDASGAFTFVTEDSMFILGYTSEELMGRTPDTLFPDELLDDFRHWWEDILENTKPFSNVEVQVCTKEQEMIWLQVSGVPYFDDDKVFQGYRGAGMNITEQKEQREAIKASERTLRALAESAYDGIVMLNPDGRISFWNDSAEQIFGYTESEALGSMLHDLVTPPEEREKAHAGFANFVSSGEGSAVNNIREVEALHKSGKRFPLELSVASFRMGAQWYAVGTVRDITERKATETKLRELATTDGLTKLNNRRRFMELAEQELTRTRRYRHSLAMFMMDIDHFKRVNDTYGHDVGDEVLRSLSITASDALRDADILGRLGGEEFGILLPETEADAAMEVAERLRRAVENTPIPVGDEELNITVSIGVAVMHDVQTDVAGLLKRADVALYNAKENGRNRVMLG